MRLFCMGLALFAFACGHSHDDYASFQSCYDEHIVAEALPINEAIVVCCLDHPINGNETPCGATAPECVTFLGANLTTTATSTELETICDEYITQKGM
jgi:hypothetical protein